MIQPDRHNVLLDNDRRRSMTNSAASDQRALWCSIIGGIAAIALSVFLRSILGTRLLAEVILDATTDGSSPENFSFLLRTLEELARPLLFISVTIGQLAVYLAVWRRTAGLTSYIGGIATRELAAVLISAAAFIAAPAVIGTLFDAGLGSATSWPEYVVVALFCSLVFVLISRSLEAWDASISGAPVDSSRRLFLGKGPALAIGIVAVYVVGAQVLNTRKGGTQQGAHPGRPTPEVTDNDDFYVVSKNLIDPPKVDITEYRLKVSGAVAQDLELNIEAIRAMPAIEQFATFQCISNEVGGYLMGNALWRGVLLRDFLAAVEPDASAHFLWFESTDDYTESLPLDFAALDGVMLAYEMNGVVLPQEHGFPLRLVAPGKYGMKQPKWIRQITLRDDDEDGYWSRRGWDTEAAMQTSTRIDVPEDRDVLMQRTIRVEGVAFSGRRGIERVEVSVDNGSIWSDAVLQTPLSGYTWVLWHYDWQAIPTNTRPRILARATDAGGVTQTASHAPPFPKGASGYPAIEVKT
jgi:DMSO/TMAO reductase YedYZ molybdopterin-dependent catalytic subunit